MVNQWTKLLILIIILLYLNVIKADNDTTLMTFSADWFTGNFDIYTFNPINGQMLNITERPQNDYNPRWSPQKDKILFLSENQDENIVDIYVYNIDNQQIEQLTQNLRVFDATWSINSDSVTYIASIESDKDTLVMYNLDLETKDSRLIQSTEGISSIAWSYYEHDIYFVQTIEENSEVFAISLDDREIRQITHTEDQELWVDEVAEKRLLLVTSFDNDSQQLYTYTLNLASMEQKVIFTSDILLFRALPSPRGDSTAILSQLETNETLALSTVNLNTGFSDLFIFESSSPIQYSWSPSSDEIVTFSATDEGSALILLDLTTMEESILLDRVLSININDMLFSPYTNRIVDW